MLRSGTEPRPERRLLHEASPGWTDTCAEVVSTISGRSPDASSSSAGVPSASGRAGSPARRGRSRSPCEIAEDLGISESCLRNWMAQADIDDGPPRGPDRAEERDELVELRRETRVAEAGDRDPQAGGGLLRPGERPPKMTYTFIAERCSDLPVATCCRVMKVSTSGFYAWRAQPGQRPGLGRRHA